MEICWWVDSTKETGKRKVQRQRLMRDPLFIPRVSRHHADHYFRAAILT
jgi:hypothetical protein